MRILHTSDWHLGKRLEDRPRLDEQKKVLFSLVNVAKERSVDVVIVAGDVFDTFTPPAEAEKLFFDTLFELSSLGVAIIIISGNHDDPTRVSASANLTAESGVFFADGAEDNAKKDLGRVLFLGRTGDNILLEDKSGEKVRFALLPYATEARMKDARRDDESYDQKIGRYIKSAIQANDENIPCVLIAHLFMLGGLSSSSERPIELGGTRMVSKETIPESVIYTALGHLHKRQVVDKERNIIYSGSILQNAFDECGYEKSVTVFDVVGGKVENLNVVELDGYCKLEKISAENFSQAMELMSRAPDTYVELALTLNAPLTATETKALVTTYPKVILRTKVPRIA